MEMPIHCIWSKHDQFVSDDLRQEVIEFIQMKLTKKENLTFFLLENADHFVEDPHDQNFMIEHILQLIVTRRGLKED